MVWGAINVAVWLEKGVHVEGTGRRQHGVRVRTERLKSPAEQPGLYPIDKKYPYEKVIC